MQQPAIFEEHEIRRVYDEATEMWLFSVIDMALRWRMAMK